MSVNRHLLVGRPLKPALVPSPASEQEIVATAAYERMLRSRLARNPGNGFTCVDGWAGAGGLSLGFEAAGFHVTGYEMDSAAVATYEANLEGPCHQVVIDEETEFSDADVFMGGPPCQPFSVIGKQKGANDPRDGLPVFIRAVERLRPKVWLFENVQNLLGRHAQYLDDVLGQLEALGYHVTPFAINATDFGVPQSRRRLVVVGSRRPFTLESAPGARVTAGVALGGLARRPLAQHRHLTPSQDAYIQRYEKKSKCKTPRDLHLDRPARTLTCRNLAGATSDMHRIRLPDGRRRRLSVAEAARLQSFPPGFTFTGTEYQKFTQIGNAVPPLVARHLADSILDYLNQD